MPLLFRIFTIAASAVAIGLALWLSISLFLVILIAGAGLGAFLYLRGWLVGKGILNPTPGVPMSGRIIEGEFEQIENPMVRDERTDG